MITQSIHSYNLLINNLPKLFNIKTRKLIISGDSAGGFFTLNLTKYLIMNNLPIPNGLIMIYPCNRIYFDEMLPSHLLCLDDCMIDCTFIPQLLDILVISKDLHEGRFSFNDNHNFYLTDSEVVRKFPPSYFIVASNDVVRDESYLLMDLLLRNGVSARVKEFLYHPHGFMNLTSLVDRYYKMGVRQYEEFARMVFNE